ncbi:MAG TPA: sigma-70 family RNA polymerase sigma factor [Trebonia sp.]
MGDSEIVASIVAGDPAGLAAAYDRYASDLYGYCRSLVHESDDAADAVQDTFVIAASKLNGLREPERLRAWLFAVARNECLHRLKSRRAAAALQDIPEPVDDTVDVGGAAERAETVALVRAAAAGLNDGERDVLNQLWHGLEVPEVAAVLGVSRNHAYSLFSRARTQLEASVGVLLVGRTGRRDCAALDRLLGDWDGRLTARLRRRVGRHIDQCRVCSDRRRQELSPAMLYGLTPGALLAMAAFRGLPTLAGAGPLAGLLAGIRDTVLRLVTDPGPHAAALRAGAGPGPHAFTASGYPKTLHTGRLAFLHRPHLPLAVVSGTAVATAATATVVVTAVAPPPRTDLVPQQRGTVTSAPLAGTTPLAGSGTGPGSTPGAPGRALRSGPPLVSAAATGAATLTQGGGAGSGTGGASVPAGGPSAIVTATVAAPGSGQPSTFPASEQAPDAPTTAAAVPPGSSSAPATVTVSVPVAAGTLTLSTTTVLLTPLAGGSVTLTANGGPVSWSVAEPQSLLGRLTVSPSSGTLDAGQSVKVSLSVVGLLSLNTQLTVEPGDHTVTVALGAL